MKQNIEKIRIDSSSWFRHWFDTSFYHKLYSKHNEEEAAYFIDALIDDLKPPQHASMLDLGCGAGRHSKRLASKGFTVSGLDLAASSIRIAKNSETDALKFYRHDMRVPFGKSCFAYVFNLFTSFGYFKNDHENYKVVNNISDSLTADGILVLDYLNVQFAEQNLIASEVKEIDGIIYHIERWTDERFFYKKITIEDMHGAEPIEYTEQVAKFNISDFDLMFKRNGLWIQKLFGDYCLNDYNSQMSPRLILVAKKVN